MVIKTKPSMTFISECSKLALKDYKTKHDWVGKVIKWELRKKLKFDYTNKWYMHNPESVLENEAHKLHRDFDIQTDHQISARQPDQTIINKKKTRELAEMWTWLFRPTSVELKECKKRDQFLDLAR